MLLKATIPSEILFDHLAAMDLYIAFNYTT